MYKASAPSGLTAAYAVSVLIILAAFFDRQNGDAAVYYLVCGVAMLFCTLVGQVFFILWRLLPGPSAPYVSDYDRSVIGNCFVLWPKRIAFFSALQKMHEDEYDDALDMLREMKGDSLSETEKGIVSFYTSVCYSRMGYPTNAAHCAAEAVEKNVRLPETLLMAARDYSLAGSRSEAEEYYLRLVEIAERDKIFPFVFNEMGKLYLNMNKADDAEKYFRKSMEYGLDPGSSQAGMALAKLIQGKEDEAAEWYRLALISRVPDIQSYKEFCGQVCIANGYPEDFLEKHLAARFAALREKKAQ